MKILIELDDYGKAKDVMTFLALTDKTLDATDLDSLWDLVASFTMSLDLFLHDRPGFFSFNRTQEWRDMAGHLMEDGQLIHTMLDNIAAWEIENGATKETNQPL